ncbi:hypothetical protein MMC28_008767 [Mycoblastus sanguinarius]|nr:hypothetical protein [Mycoblastus sanguinarius]
MANQEHSYLATPEKITVTDEWLEDMSDKFSETPTGRLLQSVDTLSLDANSENRPFTTPPTAFLQTPWQKERTRNSVRENMDLAMKKMKKAHRERQQRLRKEKKQATLETLPNEIMLHIIRHMDPHDIRSFRLSGEVPNQISRVHDRACRRGMELEQFSEYKWLFGDSTKRSPTQIQHMRDAVIHCHLNEPTHPKASTVNPSLRRMLDLVDSDQCDGWVFLCFLKQTQIMLDWDLACFETCARMKIKRRAAIVFQRLTIQRMRASESQSLIRPPEGPPQEPSFRHWSMKERMAFLNEQPLDIQREICLALERVVSGVAEKLQLMGEGYWKVVHGFYLETGLDRVPKKVQQQMGELVVGVILHHIIMSVAETAKVLYHPHTKAPDWWDHDVKGDFDRCLIEGGGNFVYSLGLVKEELALARMIGFDMRRVMIGSVIEKRLDEMWMGL